MTTGQFASALGLPDVPAVAERIGLERDLALAEATGARYHADQLSTACALPALARAKAAGLAVSVDSANADELRRGTRAGADFLLCDNMSPAELREVVAAVGDRAELEATGGLTLAVAAEYAATGVDYLSVGALTHSSPIVDIALDLRPTGAGHAVPGPLKG